MVGAAMDAPLFMDAVITPNRSLTSRGLVVLILTMTALDGALAALFVAMGAAPIPIFLGVGLIAAVVALVASHRAAARRERIQVSAAEVRVTVESRRGAETVWTSPTAFTRVSLAGEDDDESRLHLRLSDRELAVARSLSRRERRDFAAALERAIERARSGRF
ncbi:MAG: DUF2244 domain-containing protein [Caulobacteraceae bacterium]